jgi:hypothetical protein
MYNPEFLSKEYVQLAILQYIFTQTILPAHGLHGIWDVNNIITTSLFLVKKNVSVNSYPETSFFENKKPLIWIL